MPVEFLSDREVADYGRFAEAPSPAELDRWFFLDDADKALISRRRGDHHRLGFAVQLTTVRFVGAFLTDPLDVVPVNRTGRSDDEVSVIAAEKLRKTLTEARATTDHARTTQQMRADGLAPSMNSRVVRPRNPDDALARQALAFVQGRVRTPRAKLSANKRERAKPSLR